MTYTRVKVGRDEHGMSRTPLYRLWGLIIQRCENPNNPSYDRYGGRGIRMCERWRHDFMAFAADMGARPSPRHSIERIDNDGPYSPGNCAWATSSQQARNRRSTRTFTSGSRSGVLADWASWTGISRSLLAQRIYVYGWDFDRAISTPVRKRPI